MTIAAIDTNRSLHISHTALHVVCDLVYHMTFVTRSAPPCTPRAWSCINVCEQHSVQWGVYFECIVCCWGSVTKHDKLKSINVREIETFVERTAACQYVRLCTCGCFVYLCVCVCIGGGGTMEPRYALARHPDRKWTVIGRKGEANRKHFPVKCLLLCSHVNTHSLTATHTHTHIHSQVTTAFPCRPGSFTHIRLYLHGNAHVLLFIHSFLSDRSLFVSHVNPPSTNTHTHTPPWCP